MQLRSSERRVGVNAIPVMFAMLRALQLQLRSMDAAIAAVMALAETSTEQTPVSPDAPCPHPAQSRQKAGTMGRPNLIYCDKCHQTFEE